MENSAHLIKKQPPSVLARFEQLSLGSTAISLVTYGELEYGALRSNNAQKALQVLEEFVNYIPVLPMALDVGKHYADILADLTKKGTPIGNNDLWIAAHARALELTLVSNNIKEFERVQNLHLENWI